LATWAHCWLTCSQTLTDKHPPIIFLRALGLSLPRRYPPRAAGLGLRCQMEPCSRQPRSQLGILGRRRRSRARRFPSGFPQRPPPRGMPHTWYNPLLLCRRGAAGRRREIPPVQRGMDQPALSAGHAGSCSSHGCRGAGPEVRDSVELGGATSGSGLCPSVAAHPPGALASLSAVGSCKSSAAAAAAAASACRTWGTGSGAFRSSPVTGSPAPSRCRSSASWASSAPSTSSFGPTLSSTASRYGPHYQSRRAPRRHRRAEPGLGARGMLGAVVRGCGRSSSQQEGGRASLPWPAPGCGPRPGTCSTASKVMAGPLVPCEGRKAAELGAGVTLGHHLRGFS